MTFLSVCVIRGLSIDSFLLPMCQVAKLDPVTKQARVTLAPSFGALHPPVTANKDTGTSGDRQNGASEVGHPQGHRVVGEGEAPVLGTWEGPGGEV